MFYDADIWKTGGCCNCITPLHTLRVAAAPLSFLQNLCIFLDRPLLLISPFTSFNQVFLGHPLSLLPPTSTVIRSASYSCSACPNHLNLLFLITKLTCSNLPTLHLTLFPFLYINLITPISLITLPHTSYNSNSFQFQQKPSLG